jgi:hypothetical protein
MAMARFADRFRRSEPAPDCSAPRAPASLLSVEPEIESSPARIEPVAARAATDAPVDARPPLLRRLAGEDSPSKRKFGLRSRGNRDDTILGASPSAGRAKLRTPRIDGWLTRLTGQSAPSAERQDSALDEEALEDIRRQMDRPQACASTADLQDAEKRLTLALSKAGWLAEEIARCNSALEQARGLIRDEELKLARLRGLREGIDGQIEHDGADLDSIQQTLERLRRMVSSLDEPR